MKVGKVALTTGLGWQIWTRLRVVLGLIGSTLTRGLDGLHPALCEICQAEQSTEQIQWAQILKHPTHAT